MILRFTRAGWWRVYPVRWGLGRSAGRVAVGPYVTAQAAATDDLSAYRDLPVGEW